MADMYGIVRSNDFKVKDPAKFRAWFEESCVFGTEIELWEDEGNIFSFGGDEQYPSAYPRMPAADPDDNPDADPEACRGTPDWELDAFADAIRRHLARGETFQVVSGGAEKLRYVGAQVLIVPPEGKPVFLSLYSDANDLLESIKKAAS